MPDVSLMMYFMNHWHLVLLYMFIPIQQKTKRRDKYNLIHQLDESLNSTSCYPIERPAPKSKKHQFKK